MIRNNSCYKAHIVLSNFWQINKVYNGTANDLVESYGTKVYMVKKEPCAYSNEVNSAEIINIGNSMLSSANV